MVAKSNLQAGNQIFNEAEPYSSGVLSTDCGELTNCLQVSRGGRHENLSGPEFQGKCNNALKAHGTSPGYRRKLNVERSTCQDCGVNGRVNQFPLHLNPSSLVPRATPTTATTTNGFLTTTDT